MINISRTNTNMIWSFSVASEKNIIRSAEDQGSLDDQVDEQSVLVSPVEPHKKRGGMEVEAGRARRLTDRMRQEYFSVRVSSDMSFPQFYNVGSNVPLLLFTI